VLASTQRPGAEEYKSAGASAVIMSRLNSELAEREVANFASAITSWLPGRLPSRT